MLYALTCRHIARIRVKKLVILYSDFMGALSFAWKSPHNSSIHIGTRPA